jgi:hypothetical protein
VKDLLIMDAIRGPHSTGLAVVDDNKKVQCIKSAVTPLDFLDMKKPDLVFKSHINRVLIGHNRYATKGAINSINAHPFEHGNIIGVHNGTLRNQSLLAESKYFDVDSENIIHSLDNEGTEATVKKLNGAYAREWWDKAAERLNFIRNHERTLHYTLTGDGKTLFWASEPLMLATALDRRNIVYGDILPFTEDFLYQFDMQLNLRVAPVLEKPTVRKLDKYVYVAPPRKAHKPNNVKKFPARGKQPPSDSSVPEFLASRGYTLDSCVPFYIKSVRGAIAFGETLDENSCPVRVHTGSPEAAQKLNDSVGFFESTRITGFTKAKVAAEGWLSMSYKHIEPKEWVALSTPHVKVEGDDKVDEDFLRDHNGYIVTRAAFARRYKDGCGVCQNPPDYDIREFTILGEKEVICDDCKDLPFAVDMMARKYH